MKSLARFSLFILVAAAFAGSCQPAQVQPQSATSVPTASSAPTTTPTSSATPAPTTTPLPLVPNFSHIAMIVFENKEFDAVVGNRDMPYFNLLSNSYALLAQHYAVSTLSLPNYLAFVGGSTFDLTDDCEDSDCRLDKTSLPDLIEASGRTWKTYQDDMPDPCFLENTPRYSRTHNPFIFFDAIRMDEQRCRQRILPLEYLDGDLAVNDLPDFIFISPDICYSSRECPLALADDWLKDLIGKLYPALDATGEPYLIIVTWSSGQSGLACCGLPVPAGGRVATLLISPQVKSGFQDNTPYSHYSILKTISEAWGLPYLGHAADQETALIAAPWK